jgi:hypothetical protein
MGFRDKTIIRRSRVPPEKGTEEFLELAHDQALLVPVKRGWLRQMKALFSRGQKPAEVITTRVHLKITIAIQRIRKRLL